MRAKSAKQRCPAQTLRAIMLSNFFTLKKTNLTHSIAQLQHIPKPKHTIITNRGARRNFFRRGKRRIHYLLDKIKPYNCNQDFAKGFEPKVSITLLKKMLKFGRHVEQNEAIQVYYGRGSGGKAPDRWAIFAISGKNNHFNVISITFRTFLRPLDRTKMLILKIYLKFLNCLAL